MPKRAMSMLLSVRLFSLLYRLEEALTHNKKPFAHELLSIGTLPVTDPATYTRTFSADLIS